MVVMSPYLETLISMGSACSCDSGLVAKFPKALCLK
jgi:hypothetical protein